MYNNENEPEKVEKEARNLGNKNFKDNCKSNQPRKNFDTVALKIGWVYKTHGIIQPIVLNESEDGKYIDYSRERRWKAAKIAGLTVVPAFVKKYTAKQVKEIAIIENLQREDLNPIEAARAIKQLMEEYSLTQRLSLKG